MITTATLSGTGVKTSTGNGSSVAIRTTSNAGVVALGFNVTAVSGTTPTLDLSVQWSNDGTTWFTPAADTFPQITAIGTVVKEFVVKGAFFRFVYTIGGTTPSFTFTGYETQA